MHTPFCQTGTNAQTKYNLVNFLKLCFSYLSKKYFCQLQRRRRTRDLVKADDLTDKATAKIFQPWFGK